MVVEVGCGVVCGGAWVVVVVVFVVVVVVDIEVLAKAKAAKVALGPRAPMRPPTPQVVVVVEELWLWCCGGVGGG